MCRCLCRSHLPGQGSFQGGILATRLVAPQFTPQCTVRPTLPANSGRVPWRKVTLDEAQFGGRQNDEEVQTRLEEVTRMATMQTSATTWAGGDGARVGASLEVRVVRSSEPS